MKVFHGFDQLPTFKDAVCSVGSYDGVHIGHKQLIERCVSLAREIGGESVILTFEPHPRIVLGRGEGLKLLTTLPEKIERLRGEGVDNLVVIPFDEPFSKLKYSDFVKSYLIDKLSMRYMVIGYNHLFGHRNEGDFDHLTTLSHNLGFGVEMLPELRHDLAKVSSTVIRRLIESGDVESATQQLDAPYLVLPSGNDINSLDPLKLLPPSGCYDAFVDGARQPIEIAEGKIIAPSYYRKIEILKPI
ncbi:MAG: FAD synthetase [Rikenellaceae bacterium]